MLTRVLFQCEHRTMENYGLDEHDAERARELMDEGGIEIVSGDEKDLFL